MYNKTVRQYMNMYRKNTTKMQYNRQKTQVKQSRKIYTKPYICTKIRNCQAKQKTVNISNW